jgi:hypothetical protein
MGARRLLLLLVLLGVVSGGIFALWRAIGDHTADAPEALETAAEKPINQMRPSALEAPSGALESERDSRKADAAANATSATEHDQNFPLDGALWIEGSVHSPNAAPNDDSMQVWVVVERYEKIADWTSGVLDSLSVLGEVRDADRNTRWSHRAVDASGHFRVPCPGDAPGAFVLLEARYLYVASPKPIDKTLLARPLELTPELGACLALHCRSPEAAGGGTISMNGRATLTGFHLGRGDKHDPSAGSVSRLGIMGADGSVEVRGLPVEARYTLAVNPEHFADIERSPIALAAGQTTELELALKYGARVSGHVVDEQHSPVAGAHVTSTLDAGMMGAGSMFFSNREHGAETASDGSFEFGGLTPGKQTLSATLEGWAGGETSELALIEDQHLTGVEIIMARGCTISGSITWPDGTPAKNAGVHAIAANDASKAIALKRIDLGAKADANGKFTISGLQNGPFRVSAAAAKRDVQHDEPNATPIAVKEATGDTHSTRSGKKAVTWIASQSDVSCAATDLSLVLRAPPGLRGRVVDANGAPLTTFTLTVNPYWGSGEPLPIDATTHEQSFVDEAGSFVVDDVSDGDWTIAVKADAFVQSGGPPSIRVPQVGEPLVIKMIAASNVEGVVLEPSGKPAVGARVRRHEKGSGVSFTFGEDDADATTDDKGAFVMRKVPARACELFASSDSWADSEPVPTQVTAGQNVEGLVLRLRIGGTLVGEVWDARGAHAIGRNVQAVLMATGAERQSTVDDAGAFRCEHLAPGTYQVMLQPSDDDVAAAVASVSGGKEADPTELLGNLKMASCVIKDGELTHVVLGAPPKSPVKLSGRVTQAGAAVSKCTLLVMNEGGSAMESIKFGKVDASGHYEITLNKPGDLVLVVSKELGKVGADYYLTIPEVTEYTFDIDLPVSAIRGAVRGPDGKLLANVAVELVHDADGANILGAGDGSWGETDASGRYSFDDLPAGTYAVAAGGLSSEGSGEDPSFGRVVRGGLHVEKDRTLDPIDLTLTRSGTLSGVVRGANGETVPGAAVFVRDAQGELLARNSSCTSDADGEYKYKGLASGSYTVSARSGAQAAADGASVRVQDGETARADITLGPGTLLRVSAVGEKDKPLKAGISVKDERGFEVASMHSSELAEALMTEGLSSIEQKIGPLPVGKYVVTAMTIDGKSAKKPLTLSGQPERSLSIHVP